jgi:hypothetical protein
MRVEMSWADPRLTFLNLNPYDLNLLSQTEYDTVWKPIIRFINKKPNMKVEYYMYSKQNSQISYI